MIAFERLLELTAFQMCIDFRAGDALMAQEALNHPDVCAILDQMGRERMTNRVRAYGFLDARLCGDMF